MGELAGILGIVSAIATAFDITFIVLLLWERIKLNEFLSICVWASRYAMFTSMVDWQNIYNGKLTPDEILELKGWEYHHTKDRDGREYSVNRALWYLKTNQDTEHISIYGLGKRTDGKEIGKEIIRKDT